MLHRQRTHGSRQDRQLYGPGGELGPRMSRAALLYRLIDSAKLSEVNPKTYLLEATHAGLANPGPALLPHALPT